MSEARELKRTPLFEIHQELGARIVPFAGYEMPVQYSSIIEEHLTVRNAVGLFDVSHMGELELRGPDALANLQRLTCNDVAALGIGQAQYSGLLYPEGTFVDDLLVYRLGEDHYMCCINAANTDKDVTWVQRNVEGNLETTDLSAGIAQIAVQGPRSRETLQPLTDHDLASMKYYWATHANVCGHRVLLSRTGYTGELGYEIYADNAHAAEIWRALMKTGAEFGVRPIGLAARDTLRLEAGMHLYGNDIDHTTTPLEAGLDWIVKFDKGPFFGRDVLLDQKAIGLKRKLAGFKMVGRGIPRHDYPVLQQGRRVGRVTSGTQAPFLGEAIGMAYVPLELAAVGSQIEIEIRGSGVPAEVVPLPFYAKKTRKTAKKGGE